MPALLLEAVTGEIFPQVAVKLTCTGMVLGLPLKLTCTETCRVPYASSLESPTSRLTSSTFMLAMPAALVRPEAPSGNLICVSSPLTMISWLGSGAPEGEVSATLSVVKPEALMELVAAPLVSFRPTEVNTGLALTGFDGESVTTSTFKLTSEPLESVKRSVAEPSLVALTVKTEPLMEPCATAGLLLTTW